MAVVNQELQDTNWKTIIKTTISSTNSSLTILNVSDLLGWVTGSIVNLSAIEWSVDEGTSISWDGTDGSLILHFNGSGSYGGSDGMPAIPTTSTGGTEKGDVILSTDAACNGTIVCVYHKVETTPGHGNGWSA